ncbi:MAG: hypothetical protein WCT20_05530 [Candidatus Babeliales bacterium]
MLFQSKMRACRWFMVGYIIMTLAVTYQTSSASLKVVKVIDHSIKKFLMNQQISLPIEMFIELSQQCLHTVKRIYSSKQKVLPTIGIEFSIPDNGCSGFSPLYILTEQFIIGSKQFSRSVKILIDNNHAWENINTIRPVIMYLNENGSIDIVDLITIQTSLVPIRPKPLPYGLKERLETFVNQNKNMPEVTEEKVADTTTLVDSGLTQEVEAYSTYRPNKAPFSYSPDEREQGFNSDQDDNNNS